jgi:hypothetical protein
VTSADDPRGRTGGARADTGPSDGRSSDGRPLVLLHSPLTDAAAWGRLAEVLADAHGRDVVVVRVGAADDDRPPYAARWVAATARQVAAAVPDLRRGVVLVGHSGAGPLLPQVGFARRAAHGRVGAYVFVDAVLPRPGVPPSRLDLLRAQSAPQAAELGDLLAAGGRFPEWVDADLAAELPDPADRAAVLAGLRPRGRDWFDEPLPYPPDWPDAPCGYLRTSAPYDAYARVAGHRGWPVTSLDLGHFAAVAAPEAVADALVDLLAQL